ncbi:MAG: hypothetical protein H7Y60_14810 [Rhodospirillaceae bacterium]|nr:hypothetical protein [Rhodospirillales bacterium]
MLEQPEFSITSGIEISFDARSQAVVKKYIRARTASDFRVEILDMAEDELVAVETEAEVRDAFLRWHQALRTGTDGGQGMSWRLALVVEADKPLLVEIKPARRLLMSIPVLGS